jgi:hypothetical protein
MAFNYRNEREKAEKVGFMKTGTKYNKYGSRTGLATAMDGQIIAKNQEDEMRKFNMDPAEGTANGAYCFALTDAKGNKLNKATPLEFGGRLHYPNDEGIYRIVDQGYLDRAEEAYKEQQEYIDDCLSKAMISDEMCGYLLGVDIDTLRGELGEKGIVFDNPVQDAFNGCPDYVALLDKSSIAFSSCLNKLRMYVKQKAPIIEKNTTKKQEHDAS